MAISSVESMANYKKTDLNPHQILACLSKIRQPIDDHFRKMQLKTFTPHRVRNIEAETITESETASLKKTDAINEKPRRPSAALDCKLCGNPNHKHESCPLFPPGRNTVATFECRKCKSGLFHYTKYCPRWNTEEAKN
jgi:hypothetical protein